jgi:hypothetical protein
VGQRAPRRPAAGARHARDRLLFPSGSGRPGSVSRLVQARPAHTRHVLARRPDLWPQGRRAPRGTGGRPERPRRTRAGADRAGHRLGERCVSAG